MQTAAGGCVNGVEEPYEQFFRGAVAQLLAGGVRSARQRQGSVNHEEALLVPGGWSKGQTGRTSTPARFGGSACYGYIINQEL